jgi:hypothetical protein
MDENINLNSETTETVDSWDSIDLSDISFNNPADPDDKDVEYGSEEPEQQEKSDQTETAEPEVKDEKPETDKTEPETKPEADQSFKLKYLGEEKEVTREEALTLAQKGMDYDRIKGKYEEMKALRDKYSEATDLIEELAKKQNMTLEQFVDEIQIGMLTQKGVDRDLAAERVADMREKRRLLKENEALKAVADSKSRVDKAAQEAAEKRQKDIQEFVDTRPDVKATDIPQEVWDTVKQGKSLLTAYTIWENKKLKIELEAAKKNAENKAKTAGSRATLGNQTKRDEIEALWYTDD